MTAVKFKRHGARNITTEGDQMKKNLQPNWATDGYWQRGSLPVKKSEEKREYRAEELREVMARCAEYRKYGSLTA